VYGFRLKQLVDIIPMGDHYTVLESASSFATRMHELHKEISDKIEQSNLDYNWELMLERKLKLLMLAT